MSAATPSKPVVVFDGECPFCRSQVARIERWSTPGTFEYLPRQAPNAEQRFPILAQADFNTGMRLILPDGNVLVGADAVYGIARRLPRWRHVALIYRIPGVHALCRLLYAAIAKRRQKLGRSCEDDACSVPDADSLE